MKFNKLVLPILSVALSGGILMSTNSCNDKSLASKIKSLNKDDEFSCKDLEDLKQFIVTNQDQRNLKGFIENSIIDTSMLKKLLKKELGEEKFNQLSCSHASVVSHKANHVHIYLENSGSMDGYVKGITDYEVALADMVVEAQHYYGKENITVNFINSDIIPAQLNDISSFFKSLNPGEKPYNVGNKSVSELNELFKTVLAKTSDQDISIFISDCIYSLDKSRSTLEGLAFQQSLTKAVFLEKSKEFPLSAYVSQMSSSFSGKYFDKGNKVTVLDEEQRPYYIWILGENSVLKDFLNAHAPSKHLGFKNGYYLTNELTPTLKFELLKSTGLVGRASFNRGNNTIIDAIKLQDGKFQFSLAVDLSEHPDKQMLVSQNSYKITPGFELVKIVPIPENNQPAIVHHNDWAKIAKSKYSHVITIKSTESNFPSNFSLSLINPVPDWVENASTDDDTDIKNNLDKTFGLKFLIRGIESAYESAGIKSPKIELTLNK